MSVQIRTRAARRPKPESYYLKDAAQRLGILLPRLYQHMRQLNVVPKGTRGSLYLTPKQLQFIADHREAMAKRRAHVQPQIRTTAAGPVLEGSPLDDVSKSRLQTFIQALDEGKSIIDLARLGASTAEADAVFRWYHERRGHIMIHASVVRRLVKALGPVDSVSLAEVLERTIASYKACFQCGGGEAIALCPKCREPKAAEQAPEQESEPVNEDIEIAIEINRRREQLGLAPLPIPGEKSS